MKQRFSSAVIAFLLLAAILTGCSSAPTPAGTTAAAAETEPSDTAASTAAPQTDPVPSSSDEATVAPTQPVLPSTDPTISDGHYVFNPYLIPQEVLDYFDSDFPAFYCAVVDAYLARQERVPCPRKDYAALLEIVLRYACPLFAQDAVYNYPADYDRETGTVLLRYTADAESHDVLIRQLTEDINGFLTQVDPNASTQMQAQQAYHALCPTLTYNYDAFYQTQYLPAYHAFSEGQGICHTFSDAYLILLNQIGIPATTVSGHTADNQAHGWNYFTIDGQNYFCDLTYELAYTQGNGFLYFGETAEDRIRDGISGDWMSIGYLNIRDYRDADLAQTRLSVLPVEAYRP